jgi:hypothetical protein
VTVIYHLPEGFFRWRRMVSSPALGPVAFRVAQYLLTEQPGRVNAEALAQHFGTGRTVMYGALRQLRTWGYLRSKRTSAGYRRWLHFWQVTDEPFAFPEWPPEAMCPLSPIEAAESSLVKSCDSLDQTKDVTQPGVCSSGSKNKTRSVHKRRVPRAFDLLSLPEADRPHAAAALALLEGLCVAPSQRPALAKPLAAAIAQGWPVGALGHYLTQGMATAGNRFKVMLWRLDKLPRFDEMTAGSATGK